MVTQNLIKLVHEDPTVSPEQRDRFFRIAGLYFYDAFTAVLAAIEREWDDLSRNRVIRLELLRMRGFCSMRLRDLYGALRSYREYLAIDPDQPEVHENLEKLRGAIAQEVVILHEQESYRAAERLARDYLAHYGEDAAIERSHDHAEADREGRSSFGGACWTQRQAGAIGVRRPPGAAPTRARRTSGSWIRTTARRRYLRGKRGSAVSIAALRDRKLVLGVVYAFAYPDDDGDLIA